MNFGILLFFLLQNPKEEVEEEVEEEEGAEEVEEEVVEEGVLEGVQVWEACLQEGCRNCGLRRTETPLV